MQDKKAILIQFQAGGTVYALKNLIINSNLINEKSKIAYFCGDNVSYDLDLELQKDGFRVSKIINYASEKITDLNEENKKIINSHPPDIIFIYSARSALSFNRNSKKSLSLSFNDRI